MPWVQGQYQSIFGPMVGRQQVEAAVLATLSEWMVSYVAEVERSNALVARSIPVPPSPTCFHGGIDFDTVGRETPELIVNAEPVDEAEYMGSGEYAQWYEIKVAALCVADQRFFDATAINQVEDTSRYLADLYGQALLGLLTEQLQGSQPWLGRVQLVAAPVTEFVDPGDVLVARSVLTIRAFVFPVVDQSQGPSVVPPDPYADPGQVPDAESTDLTFTAVPDDQLP